MKISYKPEIAYILIFNVHIKYFVQEEDGKFPPIFNEIINKEYVITVDVSEDNLKLNSEVYEVCDVQMDVEQKISNLENDDNFSEEPEDDLTIQVNVNF